MPTLPLWQSIFVSSPVDGGVNVDPHKKLVMPPAPAPASMYDPHFHPDLVLEMRNLWRARCYSTYHSKMTDFIATWGFFEAEKLQGCIDYLLTQPIE